MANPMELCSDEERFNTGYFIYFQHFCIVYLILPFDPGYVMQAAHDVKQIETTYMATIGDHNSQLYSWVVMTIAV